MDISEILSSLSADDIEQLKSAATAIMGGAEKKEDNQSKSTDGIFSPDMFSQLGKLSSAFSGEDNRTALIEALKPMLSEPRQQKADEAIKILRLIRLIPLLRDSGMLNGLL